MPHHMENNNDHIISYHIISFNRVVPEPSTQGQGHGEGQEWQRFFLLFWEHNCIRLGKDIARASIPFSRYVILFSTSSDNMIE